jgi:hypothetical protein
VPVFRSMLDRLRRKAQEQGTGVRPGKGARPGRAGEPGAYVSSVHESVDEERLHDLLREDPNDPELFAEMAGVVRRRAAEGHVAGDPRAAQQNAVWALSEELAHDQRAWYPLVELARLSLADDREGALRRLGVAAERDPSGSALTHGLVLLREAGDHDAALALGMGHWRPTEHPLAAGREMVSAAVDARRLAEARRHLDALAEHPDATGVVSTRRDLERAIAEAERARRP